jgi:hypothetical protein
LKEREQAWLAIADAEPVETLAVGSGWGALELARTGEQVSRGTPFAEETKTERERAWLPLLAGNLPATSPLNLPTGRWWRGMDCSKRRRTTGWSGTTAVSPGGPPMIASALSSYEQAVELTSPQLGWLFLEAINFSVELGDLVRAARIHAGADTALRADGRCQLAEVRLRLGQGDAAGAEALLEQGFELAGLREGANQLAELWCLVQQQLGTDRPVPAAYDFSMFGDD